MLSAIKTKIRNRMSEDKMKMMGQLKLMILQSPEYKELMAAKAGKKRKAERETRIQTDVGDYSEKDIVGGLDAFMGEVDMEALEEATAWDPDDPESAEIQEKVDHARLARSEIFLNEEMDDLFDFNAFEAAQGDDGGAQEEEKLFTPGHPGGVLDLNSIVY
jgi:hypothetical protein